MKKIILLFSAVMLVLGNSLYAQVQRSKPGEIKIYQSGDIEALIYKHPTFLDEVNKIDGYRIQIISTTKLAEAESAKARFVGNFDSITAHIDFSSPYYKLKVGDYPSRVDAYIKLQKIREIYPDAFIVKDRIKLLEIY